MELMFEVISRQKFSADFRVTHVFSVAGGFIGRSGECEWILPDKGKRISRRHAVISCDGKAFFIEDVSRNGIFTEPGRTSLEKGLQHRVEHGDSYIIGGYTIQARLLHRPDAYIQPREGEDWLIPGDNALSADPLVAMDQQEVLEARRRLGQYDDLFGDSPRAEVEVPSDHSSRATDSLPRVSMVPQAGQFDLPDDWDSDEDLPLSAQEVEPVPACPVPGREEPAPPGSPEGPSVKEPAERPGVSDVDVFFQALGFSRAPDSPLDRERMLRQAAEVLVAAVDGMHHCLRNRAECRNDLRLPVTIMRLSGNNPLKFTPTPAVALEHLLAPTGEGMLPPGKAMLSGFNDLHGHHMGLLAGARAAVRAVLERVSPEAVEARLDGASPVGFSRKARLWHLFRKMHRSLLDDHEGFAALFLHDFARAYDVQVRTLRPLPEQPVPKGDS